VQQLLWIETLTKLTSGLVLLLIPSTASYLFGLVRSSSRFWPRMLGALLVGMAAATFLELWKHGVGGLGLAGCICINLAGAAVLMALVVLDQAAPTRRGRYVVILAAGLLVLLSLVELAFV
jgi:hypothetical protein